jgi:hypothetical protein
MFVPSGTILFCVRKAHISKRNFLQIFAPKGFPRSSYGVFLNLMTLPFGTVSRMKNRGMPLTGILMQNTSILETLNSNLRRNGDTEKPGRFPHILHNILTSFPQFHSWDNFVIRVFNIKNPLLILWLSLCLSLSIKHRNQKI